MRDPSRERTERERPERKAESEKGRRPEPPTDRIPNAVEEIPGKFKKQQEQQPLTDRSTTLMKKVHPTDVQEESRRTSIVREREREVEDPSH